VVNLQSITLKPDIELALNPYELDFARSMLLVLNVEGGLLADGGINHKATDKGGLTKFGISQRAYPNVDIANLTATQAIRIYHRDYWRAMQCAQMEIGVDTLIFDGAVNHGRFAMTQILQRCVGAKPDGLLGPKTLAAARRQRPTELIAQLSVNRGRKYARICASDASQRPNLEGWFNRLAYMTEFAFCLYADEVC